MATTDELQPIDINGAVAVVTGGASGIGKGVVKALLGRGAPWWLPMWSRARSTRALANLETWARSKGS